MRYYDAMRFVPRLLKVDENTGVAAVEFAFIATVFLIILAGAVDLGMLIYTTAELDAAVSAGAEFAQANATMVSANPSGLSTDISNVINTVNGTGWATSAVTVNNNDTSGCYCPTGSPPTWTWGSAKACGSPCTGTGVAGQFVTITASHSVSSLFPAFGFVQNSSVSRSVIVETQ